MPGMASAPGDPLPPWVPPLAAVLDRRLAGVVRGGGPLLVGLDGRSGAGKTLLAGVLARRWDAQVVHMDDLYDGWRGLASGVHRLCREVVGPLGEGRTAAFRRYDWHAGGPGEALRLAPRGVVVVEGVGCTCGPCGDRYHLRVWLEAPRSVRRSRALDRDGVVFAPHWLTWAEQEEAVLAGAHPRQRAHVVAHTGGTMS